ncbi:YveK family protein [Caloramator australicus]|uniref:Tyrosine-protein kinase transmembrane modulator EpsC n=1 Tax=Caloramator australicus RC3 TaxID=857293 RepID=G0V448_9CLOT|nr:Wzz/FepE/Etk N-terminal domain-containing protein [Caloramator australicus]CCC57888.1 Tyrosine-protein kinase transmembrane modulator EpsC [Caloramator australicus RC3]
MEQEMTLDLRDLLEIIKKRWKMIFSVTTICILISALLSFFVLPPIYEAKVSIIIGKEDTSQEKRIDYNDIMMYQKLVKTYASIAKSRTVVEKTIQKLSKQVTYDEFISSITVTPQPDTQIMDIKVQSKDPKDAMITANTLSQIFLEESMRIYPTGSIQIIDNAVFPDKPVKPKKLLNIAIAFFLGIMISLGATFMLEYMDNTLKTESDVEKYLELPVIGIIPKEIDE